MKFGIVTFPGSNGDYDAYHAVTDALVGSADGLPLFESMLARVGA